MVRAAIFLDRDGVINENRADHVRSWADFQFLPGALDALRGLSAMGVPIFVVTNQAVVGRRLASREQIEAIHRRMVAQIRRAGGEIAEVFYCPHEPEVGCRCRKPAPGMLLAAAARYHLDLERSVLVGDAASDLLAGQRAGCRTILVETGRGRAALADLGQGVASWPVAVAEDLLGALPIVAELLGTAAGSNRDLPPLVRPLPAQAPDAPLAGVAD